MACGSGKEQHFKSKVLDSGGRVEDPSWQISTATLSELQIPNNHEKCPICCTHTSIIIKVKVICKLYIRLIIDISRYFYTISVIRISTKFHIAVQKIRPAGSVKHEINLVWPT